MLGVLYVEVCASRVLQEAGHWRQLAQQDFITFLLGRIMKYSCFNFSRVLCPPAAQSDAFSSHAGLPHQVLTHSCQSMHLQVYQANVPFVALMYQNSTAVDGSQIKR